MDIIFVKKFIKDGKVCFDGRFKKDGEIYGQKLEIPEEYFSSIQEIIDKKEARALEHVINACKARLYSLRLGLDEQKNIELQKLNAMTDYSIIRLEDNILK